MRKIISFMTAFLLATSMCQAQRVAINASLTPQQMYEKAITLLQNGNVDKGVGYLRLAAGKHNIPALKYLGNCLLKGQYTVQNLQEAGQIYEIAAKLGDAESAKILADLINSGAYNPTPQAVSQNGQVVQVINQYTIEGTSHKEELNKTSVKAPALSDVDNNIPQTGKSAPNTFAVIISNENYQEEVKVDFAIHDGETFKTYCNHTLGIPLENIHFRKDATFNNIKSELDWIKQVADAYGGKAKFIFYYAGHGFPDESSRSAYLLPVDGKGNIISTGYNLSDIYNVLGSIPSAGVLVFLDACFSGAQRGGGMLASARGIAIKAKPSAPKGNMIVFSAAKDDETAYPYKEKGHGLFTYYLLKELQDSKGECTLEELAQFIKTNVSQKSIVANGKSQSLTVTVSETEGTKWKQNKLY